MSALISSWLPTAQAIEQNRKMFPTMKRDMAVNVNMGAMNDQHFDLSLIIACYNEENHLERNVGQIRRTLDLAPYTSELIFIDDHSSDRTRELISGLVASEPDWRSLFHERNVGRGGTVAEGIRMARGRVAGFIDIDLEVHCRYIPTMVQAILQDGFDVATGHRIYKVDFTPTGLVRALLSVGYRRVARLLLGSPFEDTETGYKFFRREAILPVLDRCLDRHWFWDTEIMLESHRAGLRIIEIPTLFQRQSAEGSSLRVFSDTAAYIRAMRKYRKRRANG
jgi:glycosyltransferase involved in cell wall biosynthesis